MTLPDFLSQDAFGSIRLTGHRIGLSHLLHYYNEGYSPEMLWSEYPALSLAVIHKVIAFYLDNQAEVETYLSHCQEEIDKLRAGATHGPDTRELRRRLNASRQAQGA